MMVIGWSRNRCSGVVPQGAFRNGFHIRFCQQLFDQQCCFSHAEGLVVRWCNAVFSASDVARRLLLVQTLIRRILADNLCALVPLAKAL